MLKELDFNCLAYEWTPVKTKNFCITVRAWCLKGIKDVIEDKWVWNVYAHIYEKHPLFLDVEKCLDLPFHGGCTLDQKNTTAPLQGIRYDWQKEYQSIKVGCDYSHYGDDHYEQADPKEGIPWQIKKDVEDLLSTLQYSITIED